MMLDAAESAPGVYKSCALPSSLINVLQWLKKSLEILDPNNRQQFDVSNVEQQLDLSKVSNYISLFVYVYRKIPNPFLLFPQRFL